MTVHESFKMLVLQIDFQSIILYFILLYMFKLQMIILENDHNSNCKTRTFSSKS